MITLGTCNVQYANNLYSKKEVVLRTDRKISQDNPRATLYLDDASKYVIIKIHDDIRIEKMMTDPSKGAKIRTDIHFDVDHLRKLIDILQPALSHVTEIQDDTPRQSFNPTGMEHPEGLSLGVTYDITNLSATVICNYGNLGFSIKKNTRMYIDAEKYPSPRYHLGINMNGAVEKQINTNDNNFKIYIEYSEVVRLYGSMKQSLKKLI